MCILCVIQKWSRRLATMLPWLVIPLIGLWGLSQMLPLPYRFEVTSPRLACIFVLLVTLFWYEVLMPQLSAWRVRRNARLRERKRIEASELQKLRKTATRRCRNCFTPYRDQTPGGGKYMCSYCGHISKRPVLDLPLPPGLEIPNSGMIKDLYGKGGKILNGRVWSDNVSICPDWLDQGSWAAGASFTGKSTYSRNNTVGLFVGDEVFIDEKSHPRAYFFPHIWMTSLLKSIRSLWWRLFQDSSSREDASDADSGMLAKRGEQYQESRAEKARRKAEEKKQARLEKELLEEEERKQREEVARLVEERRRLRDEKIEAENRARGSCQRERDRKEAERRRQDRRKEKDRASSKSNSDVEEMEKKTSREYERKRDIDSKTENEQREPQKFGMDNNKGHGVESEHVVKGGPMNSFGRENAGNRYLDRMRGTFLSSSKAFTGGSFFGKVSRTPAVSVGKPNASLDHFQVSVNRREIYPAEFESSKLAMNVDDKGTNHPASTDPQHTATPKSWQQLFTQFPAVSAPSNTNVIGRPIVKPQAEVQNSQLPSRTSSPPTYDNPIEFAFSFPFTLPTFPCGSMSNSSVYPAAIPHHGKVAHHMFPEELELFEDPCYIPDPASLLGPVSESLDDFQLDMGTVFMPNEALRHHSSFINASIPLDTNKQSPTDFPASRLRVAEENLRCSAHFPSSPKTQDVHPFAAGDLASVNEKGAWQMWNSPPLVQDGLGYAGSQANWTLPVDWSRSHQEDLSNPVPQRTMVSLFTNDNQIACGNYSPQKIFPGSTFGSLVPGINEDLWSQKTFPQPHSAGVERFRMKPVEDTSQKTLVYVSPSRTATDQSFDSSPANCWSKNEWATQDSGEGTGNSPVVKPDRMYSLFGHANDK